MKTKHIKLVCSVIMIALINNFIFAQVPGAKWDRTGNTFAPTGNNSFGTFFPAPINIFTNSAFHGIVDANGNWGFGDLPIGFTPSAQLHSHQNTANALNFFRFTNLSTGTAGTDGFMIGISGAGQSGLFNFEDNQPITFLTENAPNPTPFERMRINAKNLNGFIAMGNAGNFTAGSQLHINTLGIAGGGLGAAAYGNLFRTDGLETILNQWQMFTGLNVPGLNESF